MKAQHPTILVVEDDPNDQFMIEQAFRRAGVKAPIHFVEGGFEAIDYVDGRGKYVDRHQFPYPTFLMTDLKMPAGDGFTLLENLKSQPEFAVVPTIVFSSSIDLDDIKKSYWLGASAYHHKPQDFAALTDLLKTIYEYWSRCEVPQVDITGKQLPTSSHGKMGQRFQTPIVEERQSRR